MRPGAQDACRSSAGEGLLRLQVGAGLEAAEDAGELLGGPRLAAVAAALAVGGQAQAAPGLVLGDGEISGGRVAMAGAALGAQAQTPAGDDDGVTVVPDLADLEDGRLATPAHGVLPSAVPREDGTCCACGGKANWSEISAGIADFCNRDAKFTRLRVSVRRSPGIERNRLSTCRPRQDFPWVVRDRWRKYTAAAPSRGGCDDWVARVQLAGLTELMLKSGTRNAGMAAR